MIVWGGRHDCGSFQQKQRVTDRSRVLRAQDVRKGRYGYRQQIA
jgi:hypothetical protein